MAPPVTAVLAVQTQDYRGRVRRASAEVRRFEDRLLNMNRQPGVVVRMPIRGASSKINRKSELAREMRGYVEDELKRAFDLSQMLVPVDTGFLSNTGRMTRVQLRGQTEVSGRIEYSAEYALWVHERVDLAHAAPTQAKFLSEAMRVVGEGRALQRASRRLQRFLAT